MTKLLTKADRQKTSDVLVRMSGLLVEFEVLLARLPQIFVDAPVSFTEGIEATVREQMDIVVDRLLKLRALDKSTVPKVRKLAAKQGVALPPPASKDEIRFAKRSLGLALRTLATTVAEAGAGARAELSSQPKRH